MTAIRSYRAFSVFLLFRALLLTLALGSTSALASVKPVMLRCEYRVDPLDVDAAHPRLSWQLRSDERAQAQAGYRILVASAPELLRRNQGDLWDSGRVPSERSIQIEYGGTVLRSHQPCFWKVCVWDRTGRQARWSRMGEWTMGLLSRTDWKAQWIGYEAAPGSGENSSALSNASLPSPCLRKTFTLARPVRRALLYATAAGLYEMSVDGQRVGRDYFTPGWTEYQQRLYYQTYDVTRYFRAPGRHALAAMLADGWYGLHHNGRGHLALLAQLHLDYADGSAEEVVTDGSWKASVDGPIRAADLYNGEDYDARREDPRWNTIAYDDSAWKPVRIGLGLSQDAGFADVTRKVRQFVQGSALTLVPSNTLFGDPALGVVKSLHVEYRQGENSLQATVGEGETLRIEPAGPLTIMKAVYGGKVATPEVQNAILQGHPGSPVRKTGEIRTRRLTEPKPGIYVFDLGQNFAGWARLKLQGEAGQQIVLRFAEMLNPDGTIYTTNLRAAKCTDTYRCRGGGQEEVWEPRFTFHGFRYVEVTGLKQRPERTAITGVALNSDAPRTGEFVCSSPLLNRLFQNIVWGQRSNYLEVPTDCPQRDERMGWSGDAQVFIGTGTYNMDVAPFFTAWMNTFNDSQNAEGGYPNVSPTGSGVSPAWGDAGIICPWTLYRMYGDTQIIRDHWDAMVRWIEYLKRRSQGLVRPDEGFGDWLNVGAEMPRDVIATAYFAYSARLLSEMAVAVGKTEEAATYRQLSEEVRAAFNRAFVQDDGKIKGDTQTTYLMALGFDLLPDAKRQAATDRLIALLKQRDNHLSTGFLGVNLLLPTLTRVGRADLAWTLLTNTTYPSWLYSVTQGATTIWERWDGWTREKGFQDPGMNSFNHYSYGSCGQWMFATAAGIDTDGPAFHRLLIHPAPGGGLHSLRASYDSIQGRIASEWRSDSRGFALTVTLPANTVASVYIPAKEAAEVREGRHPAATVKGIRFLRMEQGCAVFEVGSGTYRFHTTHL